jgi:sporulation protein YlmC with PRC-barrel domain
LEFETRFGLRADRKEKTMRRLAFLSMAGLATSALALAQTERPPAERPQTPDPAAKPAQRITGEVNDFAMAKRSQRADDLMGKTVVNSANENLGKLEDIVVDAGSGRILYGVLSFGGFLGVGDKLFAIPWDSLSLPADAKNLVLNISKDRLKTAEGFDKNQWPNFADEQWAAKTHKYYESTPYWQAGDTTRTDARNPRDRWYQRATTWQKASDLTGKDCHNMQNEDVGRISDLLIDPDSGRIMYGILASGGNRYAIPYSALSLSTDGKKFQVNVSKEQLKNAPSFTDDRWPNVADERWAIEVHRYYNVQPYWTEVIIDRREPVVRP